MGFRTQEHCLICYSDVFHLEEGSNGNLISKDLHVIFLLRQLFEIPQEIVTNYLLSSEGQNPSRWGIRLCLRCQGKVENSMGIFKEMLRVTRNFKRAREEIVEIVRGSEYVKRSLSLEETSVTSEMRRRIEEETREFVCTYDYGVVTDYPFNDGDSKAEAKLIERLSKKKRDSSITVTKPKRVKAVNSQGFGFCTLHLYKDATGKRFQCPVCTQVFSHLSKMKFHTIRLHMEHLFESEKLPEVTADKFRYYCRTLIENMTPGDVNISMESTKINSCTHCGKGFTDRRYLHCHWLQHHYEVLARRLHDLQKAPQEAPSSSKPISSTVGRPPGIVQRPIISCSQCLKNFAEVSELKVHVAVAHTELYFPVAKFNPGNTISLEKFRSCCQSLFRNEKYKMVGNESFGCPFCEKTYISKRNVYVHMLDNHHDILEGKLFELLKFVQSLPPPCPLSRKIGESGRRSFPSGPPQQGTSSGGGVVGGGPGPLLQAMLTTPRVKRKDNLREPTFVCVDCGSKFGYSSVLTRHRKFNCPVRRSLGLITDDNQQQVIRPCTSGNLHISAIQTPSVSVTPVVLEEETVPFVCSTANQGGAVNFYDQSVNMEVTTEPVVMYKCDDNEDDIEVIFDGGDPLSF